MVRKSGSADLPLHGGRVPKWLADRMTRLGAVISEAIVHHYGRDELLRRLAHPFWFQSFGAVMGMDWHSSGITTSVIGALKRGLTPLAGELGLHVCGGRGNRSRETPQQLVEIGDHCMLANGCFVTDSSHRYDDPARPVPWQGFTTKGPTRIGDNCWLGANVVVTSGVNIGERCVIGANSVVTKDIAPFSIAAGVPAKVLRKVEYDEPRSDAPAAPEDR